MSADNWTACPRCEKRAEREKKKQTLRVEQAYGKVSSKEYCELLAQAQEPIQLKDTLREVYELGIGIKDDKFLIVYTGSCTCCGFIFRYRKEEELKIDD